MGFVLFLVFIVLPLVELAVFIQVVHWIGALNAVGLLLLVSVVGVLIVRHAGIGVYRRVRGQLRAGVVPGIELVDGLVILVAGVLLIVPGFVTSVVGLILLLPPTRHLVRRILQRRFSVRVATGVVKVVNTRGSNSPSTPPSAIEVLPPDPRALPPTSPPWPPDRDQ